jgi:hypothetical protein
MSWESNPLKARVRDLAFSVFKNGAELENAEYEAEEIGKWELKVKVQPQAGPPRTFKLKLSEAL